MVSQDYQQRLNVLEDERNELEKEFIKKTGDIIKTISGKPSEDELNRMAKISNDAFTESIKKIKEWTEKMKKLPVKAKPSYHYRVYWNRQNKQVMLKM